MLWGGERCSLKGNLLGCFLKFLVRGIILDFCCRGRVVPALLISRELLLWVVWSELLSILSAADPKSLTNLESFNMTTCF